jgi:hypothetical protein
VRPLGGQSHSERAREARVRILLPSHHEQRPASGRRSPVFYVLHAMHMTSKRGVVPPRCYDASFDDMRVKFAREAERSVHRHRPPGLRCIRWTVFRSDDLVCADNTTPTTLVRIAPASNAHFADTWYL